MDGQLVFDWDRQENFLITCVMASCAYLVNQRDTRVTSLITCAYFCLCYVFINSGYKCDRVQFSLRCSETRHSLLNVLTVLCVKEYIYLV